MDSRSRDARDSSVIIDCADVSISRELSEGDSREEGVERVFSECGEEGDFKEEGEGEKEEGEEGRREEGRRG